MGSLLGFHPPHFSEDAAWLPAWLQPSSISNQALESPSGQGLEELGCLQQSINTKENWKLSENESLKNVHLFLSGEDNSSMNLPSNSSNHEIQYHLHLSSIEESQHSLNPTLSKSQSERLECNQALMVQQPEVKVNDSANEAFRVPSQQKDNLVISHHESPSSKEKKGKTPKLDARSRKVNFNDAIELAVAASEALEIHNVVKYEQIEKLSIGSAVLEAAIRVKQARLEDFKETASSSAGQSNEVDFDFLSDLDELTMADAYEDVGLTVTSHGDLSGYGSVSLVKDSFASENCISDSKQLEVNSGSNSLKEPHKEADNSSMLLKRGFVLDSYEGGTENADLACDIHPVFSCSVEQAVFCATKVGLEKEGFAIGDLTSSRTCLRSSQQSGSFKCNEREDKMGNLVSDRFQSRWFGGWTCKNGLSIPAGKKDIPQLFANETSSISESAPDMNSCIQKQDNIHNTFSQSSIAPEHTYDKPNNTADVAVSPERDDVALSPERDDVALSPERDDVAVSPERDDVALSPNMSPMDPLCSVVPCSFTSNTTEPNLDNQKRVPPESVERHISKVNSENMNSSTISRQVVPLKTYSMINPTRDPYIDKEKIHVKSFPFENSSNIVTSVKQIPTLDFRDGNDAHNINQTANGDRELTSQLPALEHIDGHNQTPIGDKELTSQIPALDSREDINSHSQTAVGNKELTSQTEKEVHLQNNVSKEVVASICKSYLVPRRKRVRFSEPEICYPQAKRFKKLPPTRLKDPSVASRICKNSNLKPKSRDKKTILQDLNFLITGFSVKKHKELKNLIEKNGGIVLDDIPCSTSRNKKFSKITIIILCTGRLLTTKFLFGCAVNACILKVKWLFDSLDNGSILPPKKYMVLKEHVGKSSMVIGKPASRDFLIFNNVAVMLHGKPDFCSKMGKVVKHGGGLVFKTIHWLVKSVESKKVVVGVIVVEDENGISRQLKQCALEKKIGVMPFSWIVNSLYAGKLLSSPELEIPQHVELSEEI